MPNMIMPPPRRKPPPPPALSLAKFLESTPPTSAQFVEFSGVSYLDDGHFNVQISPPSVRVYCSSPQCRGDHSYDFVSAPSRHVFESYVSKSVAVWLYRCRHCRATLKSYAVLVTLQRKAGTVDIPTNGHITKIGELPEFGAPKPSDLSNLVAKDADLFEKGLKSENRGLGIGAFAYYRRVVESQMTHLLAEIERVAGVQGVSAELQKALVKARATDSFTRALEEIKGALPASLRVDGHNPLQLIYDQLSDGVHNLSDEECLLRAQVIREALSGIASRIATLLQENTSLRKAVSALTALRNPQAGAPPEGQIQDEEPSKDGGA